MAQAISIVLCGYIEMEISELGAEGHVQQVTRGCVTKLEHEAGPAAGQGRLGSAGSRGC